MTRSEPPVMTSQARSAGHLERHKHPLANATLADLLPDRDHLRHSLMSDSKRTRKETERRHRLIEITARDGERTHERTARVRELRLRSLLPCDPSGFEECELAHHRSA
jgi:hypothetical protein